jgi:hypothetical protein
VFSHFEPALWWCLTYDFGAWSRSRSLRFAGLLDGHFRVDALTLENCDRPSHQEPATKYEKRNSDYDKTATAEGVAQATAVDLSLLPQLVAQMHDKTFFARTSPCSPFERPGLILLAACAPTAHVSCWLPFSEKDAGTDFCYHGMNIALVIPRCIRN